jgi:HEAT repeat protein
MDNKINKLKKSEIHELIIKLGSDNGMERQKARESLVKIGRDTKDFLMELLSRRKHIYRWEALKTMEEIGDPVFIPSFIQALEDDKSDVRWLASKGLIKLGKVSIEPLLKLLKQKSDSIFVLEGAHHVFRDLRENKVLPKGFPTDKLLSALKNPESVESVEPLAYELLNNLEF